MSDEITPTPTPEESEATVSASESVGPGSGVVATLSKSVLNKAMWRHLITLQWSWNYERMQALGYLYSMLPVIEETYPEGEERTVAMERHLAFYNTNNNVGSPAIFGATVALEAQKEGDTVDSLKVGLMGPLAGIGDTLIYILFKPIIAVVAATLAVNSNLGIAVFGPIIMILASFALFAVMIPQYWLGYRQGLNIAQSLANGGMVDRLTSIATAFGLTVIGGFIPSILAKVGAPYVFSYTPAGSNKPIEVAIQTVLDQLLPYLVPLLLVGFVYWLIKGLKLSPVWALLILIVVAFALSTPWFPVLGPVTHAAK